MTPERFIDELGALVSVNRSQEALAFWRRHYSEVVPGMTSEQIVWVADQMHMADMANDLDESPSVTQSVKPAAQATRLA